jgi:hypothetical protein
VAVSLATLMCGELPSFVITTRALSLNGLSVLYRLRGIVLSSAATCGAVVLLRGALEAKGAAVELRVLISIVVGAAVYGGCVMLVARGVARDLLRMVRGPGAALSAAR